jgi:FkbM family methyltransferase
MRRTPLRYAERLISNRAVPWLARTAFHPGVQMVNGVQMFIPEPPAFGGGGEFHMALGTYERNELLFVLNRLCPGDVFIDVGAHIGYFSLPSARKVTPGGRVIAIEPTPSSARILRDNAALNELDIITVVEAAASDRTGTASLTTSRTSAMWNTLEPNTLSDAAAPVAVTVTTIDHVLESLGWPGVRLMKLDVEGHEQRVLAGAAEALDRNPHMEILFEVSGGNPERTRVSMTTLYYLAHRGFSFRSVERGVAGRLCSISQMEERMKMSRWQDFLFNVLATRAPASSAR